MISFIIYTRITIMINLFCQFVNRETKIFLKIHAKIMRFSPFFFAFCKFSNAPLNKRTAAQTSPLFRRKNISHALRKSPPESLTNFLFFATI